MFFFQKDLSVDVQLVASKLPVKVGSSDARPVEQDVSSDKHAIANWEKKYCKKLSVVDNCCLLD